MKHAAIVSAIVGLLAVAGAASQSALDRSVPAGEAGTPLALRSTVPVAALRLARTAHILAGIEEISRQGGAVRPPAPLVLSGKSVREALDAIVGVDRQYQWAESDGVAVVRPVTSWIDFTHPLNQPNHGVDWKDIDIRDALFSIGQQIGGQRAPEDGRDPAFRRAARDRPFSVRLEKGSFVDLLNEVVRAHGDIAWAVSPGCTGLPSRQISFTLMLADLRSEDQSTVCVTIRRF